jgi:hypothetical protein
VAFPTIHTCLICDLARPELGNKTILIGFYGAAPDVSINLEDFKVPVQLCLIFCGGGGGQGHYKVELKLKAPNGQEFRPAPAEGDLKPENSVSNFFIAFQEVLPGPGVYKATLLANGVAVYETQFSLGPTPISGWLHAALKH